MINPFSAPVLGAAAMLSSPALYDSLVVGSMPIESGVVRFVVAAAVVWLGLSLVGILLHSTSPDARGEPEGPTYAVAGAERSPAPGPASVEVRNGSAGS